MQPITLNLFVLIGIALAVMFFGYFFGLYEGRGQGYKKRKAEEHEEKKDIPLSVSAPVIKDDPGLLRLKSENNQLRLDMDGQRVETTAPLAPAQRKRLIDLLTLIRPFLEGGQPAQAAPKPAPASQSKSPPVPGPVPISPPVSSSVPLTPADQAMFTNLTQSNVEPVPARITFGLSPKKKPEQPAAALNMVQQIDEILQLKLANTPLAGQGIKIQEAPSGGVMVMVGLNKYEGVGDVPDTAIKAVLQAAVAEWEKKYTPGL
jgi:hypothetical protein